MQLAPASGNLIQITTAWYSITLRKYLYLRPPNTWGHVAIALFHFLEGKMNQDPEKEMKRPLAVLLSQILNYSVPMPHPLTYIPSQSCCVHAGHLHWASVLLISTRTSRVGSQLTWEGMAGWRDCCPCHLVSEKVKYGGWKEALLWIPGAESGGQPWLSLARLHQILFWRVLMIQWTTSLQSFTFLKKSRLFLS